MHRFVIGDVINDTATSTLHRAWHAAEDSGHPQFVAIKTFKTAFHNFDECVAISEVKLLRDVRHPCVVRLREVLREGLSCSLVYDYMPLTLREFVFSERVPPPMPAPSPSNGKGARPRPVPAFGSTLVPMPLAQVRLISFQLLTALSIVHEHDIVHRCLTPDRVLIGDFVSARSVKLCGFSTAAQASAGRLGRKRSSASLAAMLGSSQSTSSPSTVTHPPPPEWALWAAPELVIAKSPFENATFASDMFSAGLLMYFMLRAKPLFDVGGNEASTWAMQKNYARVLGPMSLGWPEGLKRMSELGYDLLVSVSPSAASLQSPGPAQGLPNAEEGELAVLLETCDEALASLLMQILRWDPAQRLTAEEALQHRFFTDTWAS